MLQKLKGVTACLHSAMPIQKWVFYFIKWQSYVSEGPRLYALILDQYHLKPLAEAIWACKISNLVSSWQNMPMTESKMSYTYVTDLSENANFSSKLSIVWNEIWLEPRILFHQLFGYWVTKGSLFLQKLQRECQKDPKFKNANK